MSLVCSIKQYRMSMQPSLEITKNSHSMFTDNESISNILQLYIICVFLVDLKHHEVIEPQLSHCTSEVAFYLT